MYYIIPLALCTNQPNIRSLRLLPSKPFWPLNVVCPKLVLILFLFVFFIINISYSLNIRKKDQKTILFFEFFVIFFKKIKEIEEFET